MERSTILTTYDEIDALQGDAFAERFTTDGSFTLGNNPSVVGPAAIAEATGQFFSLLDGMKHEIWGLWPITDGWAMEATVHYRIKCGDTVPVRGVTILRTVGDRLRDVRVYYDLSPVFAAVQAMQR